MKKKSTNNFNKFSRKKSNATIKEEFRQEKKKWKKEREEFFEKKKKEKIQGQTTGNLQPVTINQLMPLNKFIAHSGICSRRDAAEMVKFGKIKVNGTLIT